MSIPAVVFIVNVAKDSNVMQLNVSILMNVKKELSVVAFRSHVLIHLVLIFVNVLLDGHVMVYQSVSISTSVSRIPMIA